MSNIKIGPRLIISFLITNLLVLNATIEAASAGELSSLASDLKSILNQFKV